MYVSLMDQNILYPNKKVHIVKCIGNVLLSFGTNVMYLWFKDSQLFTNVNKRERQKNNYRERIIVSNVYFVLKITHYSLLITFFMKIYYVRKWLYISDMFFPFSHTLLCRSRS